jgi:hypothetical protein
MNLRRRVEALERRSAADPPDLGPITYPPRWLEVLDVVAEHLDDGRGKAAAQCATLLASNSTRWPGIYIPPTIPVPIPTIFPWPCRT